MLEIKCQMNLLKLKNSVPVVLVLQILSLEGFKAVCWCPLKQWEHRS